jgi:hypothetical protein
MEIESWFFTDFIEELHSTRDKYVRTVVQVREYVPNLHIKKLLGKNAI